MKTVWSVIPVAAGILAFLYTAPAVCRAEAPAPASAAAPVAPAAPALLKVTVLTEDWTDTERSRKIPVKIYMPEGAGPFPILVFSHGLGGSREGYVWIANHWASRGYLCVLPQHAGSDFPSLLGQGKTSMLKAAAARPADVKFVIDEVLRRHAGGDSVWKGKPDAARIGVAGHSFGAHTTMALAGAKFPGIPGASDPRVKAAIAMSTPVAGGPLLIGKTYADVTIPVYHMTGTRDDSPVGETKAADRRLPYDKTEKGEALLLNLTDADHMVFSGPLLRIRRSTKQARWEQLILESSTAFWDSRLRGDTRARDWLDGKGWLELLGKDGVFEKKAPPAAVETKAPATEPAK